jgi:chromosome segregation ATPase
MIFSQLKLIGAAVAFTAVAGMIGYGVWLKAQNERLRGENSVQKVAIEQQDATIDALLASVADFDAALDKQTETMNGLAKNSKQAQKQLKDVQDVFARHDLQDLLNKKPGLVMPRINNASAASNRMLECASDSDCAGNGADPASSGTP